MVMSSQAEELHLRSAGGSQSRLHNAERRAMSMVRFDAIDDFYEAWPYFVKPRD
jgi:hypothetical protein